MFDLGYWMKCDYPTSNIQNPISVPAFLEVHMSVKIAIIGAGFAGKGAAHYLKDFGRITFSF